MAFQTFNSIRGHRVQIDVLRQICSAQQPAHGYLFEGPQGVGKQAVAWALAARLACVTATGAEPACGDCRSCHALQRGEHPDITLLTRDGANIKIAQVREATRRLRFEPVLGRAKIVVVEDADRLREEAANALLKTLEEPALRTHFILVTSKPQLLLDTIRSRVQVLRFGPLAIEDIQELLVAEGHDAGDARIAAALAQGDLGRARSLCNPDLLAVVDEAARFVLELDVHPPSSAATFVQEHTERLASAGSRSSVKAGSAGKKKASNAKTGGRARLDREGLSWTLDVMRAVLRDVMLAASGVATADLPHARYADQLDRMASRVDPADVAQALENFDQLEADLDYNPNPRVSLEAQLVGTAALLQQAG